MMFVCEEISMIFYSRALCLAVLVSLYQNVCSAIGTVPPNTTQPYWFPCGMDRCLINSWYCDKGRSKEPGQWKCNECTEIEHWCEKNIARVPRDCLGYCEAKKCKASMKALASKYEEQNQSRGENSRLSSAVPRDETKTLNGLQNFLAENSIVVCAFTLLVVIIVGLLVLNWRQRRRNSVNGTDSEMGALMGLNPPDRHDPAPTVVTKMLSTTATQTDFTAFLGSASTDTNQVEFVQPSTKGAHGIRVLPSATVDVHRNGKDCTEDTSFLSLEDQANSAFVTNLS